MPGAKAYCLRSERVGFTKGLASASTDLAPTSNASITLLKSLAVGLFAKLAPVAVEASMPGGKTTLVEAPRNESTSSGRRAKQFSPELKHVEGSKATNRFTPRLPRAGSGKVCL